MAQWFKLYRKGFHQEVYKELVALEDQIYASGIHDDAMLVAREIMRRVRYNLELLLPRLRDIGYHFHEGFLDKRSLKEKQLMERDFPVFLPPDAQAHEQLAHLEAQIGVLPLSIRCWYEQVGGVNLMGMFPLPGSAFELRDYGTLLDPLLIMPLATLQAMVAEMIAEEIWQEEPALNLCPDGWHKYGVSGGGGYGIRVPCQAFDALFDGEPHHLHFVEYLRLCFRWGGFPGLAEQNRLTPETVQFLTQDLLPF